jgi:hypothetical protein
MESDDREAICEMHVTSGLFSPLVQGTRLDGFIGLPKMDIFFTDGFFYDLLFSQGSQSASLPYGSIYEESQ